MATSPHAYAEENPIPLFVGSISKYACSKATEVEQSLCYTLNYIKYVEE